jgi:hypothetical protein
MIMIKKLKLSLLVAVLSLAVGVSSAYATAASQYFSDYTSYTLGSYTLTVYTGSSTTSILVDTDHLDVVVPTGLTFTIASHNNMAITASGGTDASSNTCTGTTNTTTIPGADAITYTITPGAGVCNANSGGGGGGGGGGTPADTTPPTGTSVSINAGVATTNALQVTLTLAATGATQMIISNDAGFAGAPWETYATSKAWTLTLGDGVKTVYAKFRDAAGNMSQATSDTITVAGSGTVALPEEKHETTEGCSGGNQYNTSTGALCQNTVVATEKATYDLGTKTLKNGSKGEAVKELQKVLNKLLNLGLVVDGKLGPKTIAVIKKWQKAHGLKADGLVGAKTKAAMKAEAEK